LRRSRTLTRIAGSGLDALIAYDNGAKLGGGNVRYLGGFVSAPPPAPSFAVVGPTGPTVVVVMETRAGTVGNHARSFCGAGVVVVVAAMGDWATALAQALDHVGATSASIGVDSVPGRERTPLTESLTKLLPDVAYHNAEGTVEKVRRDKSVAELGLCRQASTISHTVFDAFQQMVEPGVPHQLAAADATALAVHLGGEELVLALGSGAPWIWSSATPARSPGTFQDGQPVSCEINVRYGGYFSQVARSWPLGTIDRDRQRMIDAVRAAHGSMVEAVRPGALPAEVFTAGLREIREHDYGFHGIRYGHGLGLTIGEGWDFADDDDDPEGTVLTPLSDSAYAVCHPFLFGRAHDGTVEFNALWGDPWLMTEHGAEVLC
jgi:Xaa-Pro aminopeptidase